MAATHRLDSDIFAIVRTALHEDSTIPQSVHVHVDDGRLTLTGTVRTAHEKSQAEAVVRHAAGLGPIINHIVVAEPVSQDTLEAPEFSSHQEP